MRYLAIVCLLLTGCSGVRQFNPGAQWPIYTAPYARVQQEWRERSGRSERVYAFTDTEKREIWIVHGLSHMAFISSLSNEQFHVAEKYGVWEAAIMLEGGEFHPTCSDMPAEARALHKAMQLARSLTDTDKHLESR
jgi:hypothetical protein